MDHLQIRTVLQLPKTRCTGAFNSDTLQIHFLGNSGGNSAIRNANKCPCSICGADNFEPVLPDQIVHPMLQNANDVDRVFRSTVWIKPPQLVYEVFKRHWLGVVGHQHSQQFAILLCH